MSGQVVLYFDDQADALRFALAAGSVMAGDGSSAPTELAQKNRARQPHPFGHLQPGQTKTSESARARCLKSQPPANFARFLYANSSPQ